MDNPEKLATLGTQDTGQTVVNKPQRKPKGKSRMDNPEKLSTLGTQDTGQTVDEDKQNKNTTQYVLDSTIHKQSQIT